MMCNIAVTEIAADSLMERSVGYPTLFFFFVSLILYHILALFVSVALDQVNKISLCPFSLPPHSFNAISIYNIFFQIILFAWSLQSSLSSLTENFLLLMEVWYENVK